MFDTFLRMVDEQGDELPADEFIDSARRNQLFRAIDRWVIGASLKFAARTEFDLLFVKLSDESIQDANLIAWIDDQASEQGIDKRRLCFQVSEHDASRYTKQTRDLASTLRQSGFRFAIDNFGIGSATQKLLTATPMDFVKFDGSLIERITGDTDLQDHVRELAGLATRKGVGTIATHVENADTMAVLFQLGVGFMQGHYLQEPDVVLEEAI
jgi:EAL domain-containing protein (putative c-di-GMP-specific phosphodiesterase class I)